VAPLTGRGAGARVSSRTRRAATGPLVRHPRATPCTGAARLQAGEHGNPEPRTLPVAPRGRVLGEFAPALQSRVPLFKKETGGLKKKIFPHPSVHPPLWSHLPAADRKVRLWRGGTTLGTLAATLLVAADRILSIRESIPPTLWPGSSASPPAGPTGASRATGTRLTGSLSMVFFRL